MKGRAALAKSASDVRDPQIDLMTGMRD